MTKSSSIGGAIPGEDYSVGYWPVECWHSTTPCSAIATVSNISSERPLSLALPEVIDFDSAAIRMSCDFILSLDYSFYRSYSALSTSDS